MEHMSLHSTIDVAGEVRAAIGRKQVRQSDFANALGVSQSGISRRLAGKTPFSVDELVAASAFLDVPVSSFIEKRAS